MITQKDQILEGNKLLAEFMGYEYTPFNENAPKHAPCGWWKKGQLGTINKITHAYLCRSHRDLRYYNSWDWIMTVVLKIEKLRPEVKEFHVAEWFEFHRIGTTCILKSGLKHANGRTVSPFYYNECSFGKTEIESVWLACVNFISWLKNNNYYNELIK